MAVSGTTSYNPAAVKIITAAYQILGIINEDETPTAGQFQVGMDTLNSMTKEWEATGIHVWTEEEGIIFLQQYQRKYLLGGTTPDHAAKAEDWTFATLTAAAASGDTVLALDTTGMTAGEKFGVVLDSGAAYWTTINAILSATSLRLTAAITGAVSAQACCFAYPVASQLIRPLRVPFTRRLQYAPNTSLPGAIGAPDWGGIITPLAPMMSRQEFFNLPQPTNPGLVSQAFYDPARDQGQMWVWNVPQNANYGLRFTYYRPLQDWTTPATTADFPQEWNNCLNWNLARELGPRYSVPAERLDRIVAQADKKLELVSGWDREPESVYFGRSSPQSRG